QRMRRTLARSWRTSDALAPILGRRGRQRNAVLTHYGHSIHVRCDQASTRCHAAFAGVLAENGVRVVQTDAVGGVRLEDLHTAIVGLGARPVPLPLEHHLQRGHRHDAGLDGTLDRTLVRLEREVACKSRRPEMSVATPSAGATSQGVTKAKRPGSNRLAKLRVHLANIYRLMIKELRSIRSDPIMLALVAYSFTVAIYAVATGASTEATNLSVGIVDEDHSDLSRRIADGLTP